MPELRGRVPVRRGARIWDPSRLSVDTEAAHPKAIDIVSGPTPQSSALDWTVADPVVVPHVPITP